VSGTWLSASVKNSTDYAPAKPVCQLLDRYCHDSKQVHHGGKLDLTGHGSTCEV
jgi:hypothetical protein